MVAKKEDSEVLAERVRRRVQRADGVVERPQQVRV